MKNKIYFSYKILFVLIVFISCNQTLKKDNSGDYPIKPVLFTNVKLTDNFWAPKIKRNHEVTIPIAFGKSEETGRIKNFKVAGGLEEGTFCSIYPFDDSDVFKIVEGASYSIQTFPDPEMEAYLDSLIFYFGKAQEDDGYLYTNRTILGDSAHEWAGSERWELTHELSHELYNLGHMFEAAVAHYNATGKDDFLNIAIKSADLVERDFGWGKIENVPGHQEIEIGLVKLYRTTGEERYLDLAKFFLDARGPDGNEYSQAHKKVIDQDEAVGHAVRATYMYSAMADIAALTGDSVYTKAIDRIWENVVNKKYYITGGIGASKQGEAYGENYVLPNMEAYCETCAAIANVFWNWRLFLLHGDSKYYDVLERTLYNGVLPGVSITGDHFFYPNPLESYGQHERKEWFGCACCPANITRFIPSVPGYMYATTLNRIYVNLFIESDADVEVDGKRVQIIQKTKYPWQGKVSIKIQPQKPTRFELMIRIPGWAINRPAPGNLYTYYSNINAKPILKINGNEEPMIMENGYALVNRRWKKGDEVYLELPMPARKVIANQAVEVDMGKFALERGPLVYCLEGPDNPGFSVLSVSIDPEKKFFAEHNDGRLGDIYLLHGYGKGIIAEAFEEEKIVDVQLHAIPYYLWANRGPGEMIVWIPFDK